VRGSRGVAVEVVAEVLLSAVPAGAVTTVTLLHSYRAVYVVSDARRSTTYHFVAHSATDWEEWWSPASSPVSVVVAGTTYVRAPSPSTTVPASAWRVVSPARYTVSDLYPGLVSSARLITWRQDSTCTSRVCPGRRGWPSPAGPVTHRSIRRCALVAPTTSSGGRQDFTATPILLRGQSGHESFASHRSVAYRPLRFLRAS
jgi:hypothetical protein